MSFHEVAALVIFCAVVIGTVGTVLVPITVQLPAAWHKHIPFKSVSISYAGVPVAGTLLMLMTGVLDGRTFAAGIVGDDRMKPYGIVILFMALAYMSSCKYFQLLDCSGALGLAWRRQGQHGVGGRVGVGVGQGTVCIQGIAPVAVAFGAAFVKCCGCAYCHLLGQHTRVPTSQQLPCALQCLRLASCSMLAAA